MSDDILKAYGRRTQFDKAMSDLRVAKYGLGFDPLFWPSRSMKGIEMNALEELVKKSEIKDQELSAIEHIILYVRYMSASWPREAAEELAALHVKIAKLEAKIKKRQK